jgi:pimeloyl-ACP methyl ester carboxylesterase
VVLHGVTRPGRNHPTLVRFVRALAGTGSQVLVPEIPEWADLYLAPDQASATVRAAVSMLARHPGTRPGGMGIMGFSLGVPQVLLSATDPELADHIRGVAGFGGYASLDPTLRFLFFGEHEWEGRRYRTEPDPYGRWIMGGNYLTSIPKYRDAEDVAQALLALARQAGDRQVAAWDSSLDRVKDDLMARVHPDRHDLFRLFAPPAGQNPNRIEADRLIPGLVAAADKSSSQARPMDFLKEVSAPVRLVHGRGDQLIPFSESLRLAQAFPPNANVRVYLTGLFSHSRAAGVGRAGEGVPEQLHFLRILADLLTLV